MTKKKETWRDIPGLDGFYRVSDRGNLLSCRAMGGRHWQVNRKSETWKTLRRYKTKHHRGHSCEQAALYRDGKRSMWTIHRLVWQAFKGEIPEGKIIDHVDGDPYNNCLKNLRLVTQGENQINRKKGLGVREEKRNSVHKWAVVISYKGIALSAGCYATKKRAEEVRTILEHALYPGISSRTRKK